MTTLECIALSLYEADVELGRQDDEWPQVADFYRDQARAFAAEVVQRFTAAGT